METHTHLLCVCLVLGASSPPVTAQQVTDCTNGDALADCLTEFTANVNLTTTFAEFREMICVPGTTQSAAECVILGIPGCPALETGLEDLVSQFPVLGQIIEQQNLSMDAACSNLCESHEDCVATLGPNMICTNNLCTCRGGFQLNAEGECVLDTTTNDDIVCPSTPIGCSFDTLNLTKASNGCRGYCQCSPESTDDTNTNTYNWQGKACPAGTAFDTTLGVCNTATVVTCGVVGQICSEDQDCQSQLSGTMCQHNACACSSGSVDADGTCPIDDCTSSDSTELRNMVDRSSRVSSCSSDNFDEYWQCVFVGRRLSDHNIEEAWYSFPGYRLSVRNDFVAIGDCNTYYPIYLQEPLPTIVAGGEVDVAVVVVGLEKYGDYDYTIMVRQCGDSIQYRLPAAPAMFAAYCLDPDTHCLTSDDCGQGELSECVNEVCVCSNGYPPINNVCTDLGVACPTNSTCVVQNAECGADDTCTCIDGCVPMNGHCLVDPQRNYIYISLKLNYFEDAGLNMFIPFVEFSCRLRWYNYKIEEPHVYYMSMSWYADNTLLKVSDVLTVVDGVPIQDYHLTEMDLLEAGYKLGVKWAWIPHITKGDNTTLYKPYNSVPFGCAATIGAEQPEPCDLIVRLVDSVDGTTCSSQGAAGDRSPNCFMRIPGITKYDWNSSDGDWQSFSWYDRDDDEHTSTWSGLLIRTNSDDDSEGEYVITVQADNDHSHQFWNGYTFPDKESSCHEYGCANGDSCNPLPHRPWQWMLRKTGVDPKSHRPQPLEILHVYRLGADSMWPERSAWDLYIQWNDNLTTMYAFSWRHGFDRTVNIEEQGEYVVLRSSTTPFQIHVTVDSNLRPCGLTVRRDNSIYAVFYNCDGVILHGVIYGQAEYTYFSERANSATIELDADYFSGYRSVNYISYSMEMYNEYTDAAIEGIVSSSDTTTDGESFQLRNGMRSPDKVAFVQSWRVGPDESLLNPVNYYDVALTETKRTCGCPRETAFLTDDSWSYTSAVSTSYTYIYNYLGEVMCSDDDGYICSSTTPGTEWVPSLMPEYRIKYIDVYPDLLFDPNTPPVLTFRCNVSVAEGYLYVVTWLCDEDIIIESEVISSTAALAYGLDADTVYLDGSVYSLESPVTSRNVSIGRTGDSTVSIKMNVPFGCLPTRRDTTCALKIIIFDPEDNYDCKNSTIAIRSDSSCGTSVQGITSYADVTSDDYTAKSVIHVAITTKNNRKYKLRKHFRLRVRTVVRGLASAFWATKLAAAINVTVVEQTTWQHKTCHANNDPRLRTMDGIYFSMQLVDEFIMYRHKILPIEVQIKTVSCNGGWASCICAVTVRQGRDIYTVNYCGANPITGYISAMDGTLDVYDISCTKTKVVFQHGTVVEMSVSTWRSVVNVIITASPYDVGNIQGLCGEFNGRPDDDFTSSDGTIETVYGHWWWWWGVPNDFSKSWGLGHQGLLESQSLLLSENAESNLWDSVTNTSMCVCPNDGLDEPLCSINEDTTCTFGVDRGGDKKDQGKRDYRSTRSLNPDMTRRLKKSSQGWKHSHIVKREAEVNQDSINETEALELCKQYFVSDCPTYRYADIAPFAATNETLQECAQDVALNASVDWQGSYCEVYVMHVAGELERNIEFQETHVQETVGMKEIACPTCNSRGSCVHGKCVCEAGYGTDECLLNGADPVTLNDITGGGVCDISVYGDCSCILLVGSGFYRVAQCSITETKSMYDRADGSRTTTTETFTGIGARYHSLNEVYCCLSDVDSRRRRAAASNTVEVGQQLGLSVSNDGNTYGNMLYVFVLDTTCMETLTDSNGTEVVALKAGYCYIEGSCIADGTADIGNTCMVCKYSTALFDWTPENCPTTAAAAATTTTAAAATTTTTSASPDDGGNSKIIIVATVCAIAGLLLLVTIAALVAYKHFQKPQTVRPMIINVHPSPGNVRFGQQPPAYEHQNPNGKSGFQQPQSAWMEYGSPACEKPNASVA